MRPTTIHSVLRMLLAPGGQPAFWPLGWGLAGAPGKPDPGQSGTGPSGQAAND